MWKHSSVRFTKCKSNISLKASELSPGTHHFIGQIFRDAGFPPGVLNVIQHRREDAPGVVETLIAHPATRKINFTGSTPVGSIIAKLAGQHLKPVLLELGGKAPQIVLDDADLEKAATAAIAGAWAHVYPLRFLF
jgi:vanillin dehydrogenase